MIKETLNITVHNPILYIIALTYIKLLTAKTWTNKECLLSMAYLI